MERVRLSVGEAARQRIGVGPSGPFHPDSPVSFSVLLSPTFDYTKEDRSSPCPCQHSLSFQTLPMARTLGVIYPGAIRHVQKIETLEPLSKPAACSGSGMASPLTPALSPLSNTLRRVRSVQDVRAAKPGKQRTRRRAATSRCAPIATPSPLNGERAGVRGEMVRCVACSRGFENCPLFTLQSTRAF